VLDFALPAAVFVGMVRTPRAELIGEAPFFLAVLLAFAGLYAVGLLLGLVVFRHDPGRAALQGLSVSLANAPTFGAPLLGNLYGPESALAIAAVGVIAGVLLIPVSLVLLEASRAPDSGDVRSGGTRAIAAVKGTARSPLVLAALLGTGLVLAGVDVPELLDSSLALLGATTAGVATFTAGLILAGHRPALTLEVALNSALKMVAQPALMAGLVVLLGIGATLGSEAILLCALPAPVVATMLATRYRAYEAEAAATLLVTTLLMALTLPVVHLLTG
jgi:predicted permease